MIRTKRWNDPVEGDDGYRLLVCRYRPRGVSRAGEPWDAWAPELGPSPELHAAAYGKGVPMIPWDEYRDRYLKEMESSGFFIRGFRERVARGETITLLCSSACTDPARCHRTLLAELLTTSRDVPRAMGATVAASDAGQRAGEAADSSKTVLTVRRRRR